MTEESMAARLRDVARRWESRWGRSPDANLIREAADRIEQQETERAAPKKGSRRSKE